MNKLILFLIIAIFTMTIIFFIALARSNLKRKNTAIKSTTPDESSKIKQMTYRSIKEFHKSEFQFLDEKITDNLFIYSRIALINPVNVKIFVQSGGALLFYGTSTDDITIHAGGSAIIYGTVAGNVINNGGDLHLYGKVIGTLSKNSGNSQIYGTAQILHEKSPATSQ